MLESGNDRPRYLGCSHRKHNVFFLDLLLAFADVEPDSDAQREGQKDDEREERNEEPCEYAGCARTWRTVVADDGHFGGWSGVLMLDAGGWGVGC